MLCGVGGHIAKDSSSCAALRGGECDRRHVHFLVQFSEVINVILKHAMKAKIKKDVLT